MDYIEVQLFFGYRLSGEERLLLAAVDRDFYNLYVGQNDHYLEEVVYHGSHFLGKSVGDKVDRDLLELLQLNIYSLLRKLMPSHPFEKMPLELVPIVNAG